MVERKCGKDTSDWFLSYSFISVGTFGNDSQDILLKNNIDEEMGGDAGFSGTRAEKVGPYQFVWAEGEDYYNGCGIDETDATDVSTSKVGRNSQENEEL